MKKALRVLCLGCVLGLSIGSNLKANAQIITIGTGTTVSGGSNTVSVGGSPVSGYKAIRQQVIYSASQLNSAGITGGKLLDSIAWQVSTSPSVPLKNYTIKGKMFSPEQVTQFENIGFTQLVSLPTFQPATGFVWVAFSTPLYWNGVDNIIFDICSDTVTSSPVSGKVLVSNNNNQVWGYYLSGQPVCGVSGQMTPVMPGNSGPPFYQPNIKMSFRAAPNCAGVPSTLTIAPVGPLTNCVWQTQLLQVSNAPNSTGSYQWQQSISGGAWQNVPVGTTIQTSGTGINYLATYSPGATSIKYRAIISCSTTSTSTTSNEVTLNIPFSPVFATLPYTQDFESWINECNVTDAPDSSWVNSMAMGPFSWRREDQGASAGWTADVTPSYYAQGGLSTTGSHSARVQTSKGTNGLTKTGSLLLHLNCSSPNNKELRFDYKNITGNGNPLKLYLSTDGGITFGPAIGSYTSQNVTGVWQKQVVPIVSTSATTVIKFEANSTAASVGDFDMGIDNVNIYPACTDAPTAGIVDSNSACSGSGLTLGLIGTSGSAGLSWLWQQSVNGITWDSIGNVEHPSILLNGPTWFRCIVTCTNSNMSDTSAARLIQVNPFYLCSCTSLSTTPAPQVNIGNFKLNYAEPNVANLINNGTGLPTFNNIYATMHYTDFTNLAPAELYMDSTYKVSIMMIDKLGPPNNPSMPNTTTKVYIDWDHDGSFSASEKAVAHIKPIGAANVFDSAYFVVPNTAMLGITKMRVILNSGVSDTSETWGPCSTYSRGETEDYLVKIWAAPCSGTPNAGVVTVSDTLSCPDYPFVLTNSGYDTTTSTITRIWQSSPNNTTWTDIAGTSNQDQIQQIFSTPMFYRVKSTCGASSTDAFTASVKVNSNIACYCVSYASGGFSGLADSSDIGGFSFSTLNFPLVGGHLNNPDAIRVYTNHSLLAPITLHADSTYDFEIVHTILRNDHADAKITMFIDYNGNGTYDVPAERVYSAKSTDTSWEKSGMITIPHSVPTVQHVGMRVIINNDTAANTPSDEACGIYVSGETEDFVVNLMKAPVDTVVSINQVNNPIHSIRIFPNPTTGIVAVQYSGSTVNNAIVKIMNVTGITLEEQKVGKIKDGDKVDVNLHEYAKGIYFITVESGVNKVTGKVVLQ